MAQQERPSPQVKWEPFVSYDGKFQVLAPGPFRTNVDSIATPIGTVAYHSFFHQPSAENADNVLLMVSYCDYPPRTIHSDSADLVPTFFENTIDAATESVDGNLVYSDSILLSGYPGRFWRIDYLDDQAVIKTKAFLVKNRFYSVQSIMYRNRSLNLASDKFLNSFEVLSSEN